MNLEQSEEMMRNSWNNNSTKYPILVYVETTNYCNGKCVYCNYQYMVRPVKVMSLDEFKLIANKVRVRGLKIGAMFCYGEPLSDPTIFDKMKYGRSIGIMNPYLGLNTNVTFLTPEKYDGLLETCNNITLSFVNTEDRFETLTGLNWKLCYGNAIDFIKYRDRVRPDFKIEIGCNDVSGHERDRVKKAFEGYRVDWARDTELLWGDRLKEGLVCPNHIINRAIMYNDWRCDAHKGAIQIKPNGDCCFCAYDMLKCETTFANIFKDDWDTINKNFRIAWENPQSLCLRCDYWHNYYQMVVGGWKRGPHLDFSWEEKHIGKRITYD